MKYIFEKNEDKMEVYERKIVLEKENVVSATIFDCCSGTFIIKNICPEKLELEVICVSMCYPCSKQLVAGEILNVSFEDLFEISLVSESLDDSDETSELPF